VTRGDLVKAISPNREDAINRSETPEGVFREEVVPPVRTEMISCASVGLWSVAFREDSASHGENSYTRSGRPIGN
jgi:hypothetical protein